MRHLTASRWPSSPAADHPSGDAGQSRSTQPARQPTLIRSVRSLRARRRAERTVAAILACLTLALLSIAPASGQLQRGSDAEQAGPDFSIDVDLLYMLREPREVQPGTFRGELWEVKPGPGRSLLALPFTVESDSSGSSGEIVLDARTFDVKGALFVGYRVGDSEEYATPGSYDEERLREELPAGSPRITREVVVTPSGRVKWELERFIRGGEVRGRESDYAYLLKRELLEEKSPGSPPRIRRSEGESYRAYVTRSQQQRAEWRARNKEYRELRDRVYDLPEQFDAPIPERIWAVFDVNSFVETWEFEGPPPLPWTISPDQLQTVQRASESTRQDTALGRDVEELPREYRNHVAAMLGMVSNDPHPYNLRLAAYAISGSRLARFAEPGDNLYQLMLRIGQGSDIKAKRVVVKQLLETFPPTQATRQLLAIIGRDVLDDGLQMVRLENLLKSNDRTPQTLRDILSEANRVIREGKETSISEAVGALLEVSKETSQAMSMFASGVRFQDLDDAELDRVIVRIAEAAPENELAAIWLDRELLGASDPRLTRRTLEILATSEAGSDLLRPAMTGLLDFAFGPPQTDDGDGNRPVIRLDLQEPLVVDSPRHAIFRSLQQGDSEIRALAWQVLPVFRVGGEADGQRRSGRGGANGSADDVSEQTIEIYSALLDAALAQSTTPVGIVDFLTSQPHDALVVEALIQLVLRGTAQASSRAATALLASDRDIDPALRALSYGDRHEFGKRMYQSLQRQAPLVTGLLRVDAERYPVVDWFAERIEQGVLPSPDDWLAGFKNVEQALELIPSNDRRLSDAAAAALVADAGGDERIALKVAELLRDQADRSVENLKTQWAKARQSIFRLRVRQSSGVQRLTVLVYDASAANRSNGGGSTRRGASGGPGADASVDLSGASPIQTISLGIMPLQVENDTVRLGNSSLSLSIPNAFLAITIDSAGELKTFQHEAITRLPLDQIDQPIHLRPTHDGRWRGQASLPDGRWLEILLTPLRP